MPDNPNPRPRPLAFPIILIVIGFLFLFAEWRPGFNPWLIMKTYWPLILILVGLGRIWDSTRGDQSTPGGRRSSAGSTILIIAVIFILFAFVWHGRAFTHDHGNSSFMRHEMHTVDLQGAQTVRTSIDLSAGELTIGGGSSHLLDASFNFRDSSGEPRVDYHVTGTEGDLDISDSKSETHIAGTSHSDWDLRFGNTAPLDLKINMGAGEGHLRLRDLPVTNLELNLGAGRVEADLTGDRKKDLVADIEGGVGEAVIRLPKNVGVIVNASGGIGSVDSHGLKHDGDSYTNDAYGKTPATIHLKVEGGIGSIQLIQEP
jgi:hypothetical protein